MPNTFESKYPQITLAVTEVMYTKCSYWTKNVSILTYGKSYVRVGPLKKRLREIREKFSTRLVLEGTLIYDNIETFSLFSITAE